MSNGFTIKRSPLFLGELTRSEAKSELEKLLEKKPRLSSYVGKVLTLYKLIKIRRTNRRAIDESIRVIEHIFSTKAYRRKFVFRASGSPVSTQNIYLQYKRKLSVDLTAYPDSTLTSYLKLLLMEEIDGLIPISVLKRLETPENARHVMEKSNLIIRAIIFMQSKEKAALLTMLFELIKLIHAHRQENLTDTSATSSVLLPLILGKTAMNKLKKEGEESTFSLIRVLGVIINGLEMSALHQE